MRGEREGLIRFVEERKPQGKNRITIVFDGQKDICPPLKGIKEEKVKVVFARGISADEKIKRMVEKEGAKQVVVVSDDKEIRVYVRALGARVLSVKEFIEKGGERRERKKEGSSSQVERKRLPEGIEEITSELKRLWLKERAV